MVAFILKFSLLINFTWAYPTQIPIKLVTMEYPPYMIANPMTLEQGLEIDILKAALDKSNFNLELNFYPLKRAVAITRQAEKHNLPVSINTAEQFAKEIAEEKILAVQLAPSSFHAFIRASDRQKFSKIQSLSDLKGYAIVVPRGSAIVKPLLDQGIAPLEVSSFEQMFRVVKSKRADLAIVLGLSGDYFIEKNELQKTILRHPAALLSVSTDLLIPRAHPYAKPLSQTLQKGLGRIKANGEMLKIAQRYYGKSPPPKFFQQTN